MQALLDKARSRRWLHLVVVNLRILLGFAFVPAGLKKLLGEPFTDPDKTGAFHEFLHVFHDTGFFYQFVGITQLTIALLLMTQTFAVLGAALALPVITAILVFCWSTVVIPTATVVTLMWLGTAGLLLWDLERWRGLLRPEHNGVPGAATVSEREPRESLVDLALWRRCGVGILLFYGVICALSGDVYRPKGPDPGNPAFYLFPLIVLFPMVTYAIERRRRARA